ncbi:MAG: beta-lactamase family protein [Spirochaetes bacterium]|nr:beta-lactamase family protein [Spirochaetota bacterium]
MKTLKTALLVFIIFIVSFHIVLLGMFLISPKQPNPPKTINSIAEIDQYFEKITNKQTPPSISVTVLKRGNPVYMKSFGYIDPTKKTTATKDTNYHWWSVTKLFTATAIMQLYEHKLLNLDDSVKKYLPYFIVKNRKGMEKTITIGQLLNHTSGLGDLMPEGISWIKSVNEPGINQTAFLKDKITGKFRELKFEPGTNYRYSNIGYIVLGVIIEAITGIPYEDYIKEKILYPLQMKNSSFFRKDNQIVKSAHGSNPKLNIFTLLIKIYGSKEMDQKFLIDKTKDRIWFHYLDTLYTPSTGLTGPANELALFGQVFLNGGNIGNQSILQKKTVNLILKEFSIENLANKYTSKTVNLGWKVWKNKNQIIYGHGGGGAGFGALFAIVPQRALVIAFIANDTNIKRDAILKLLLSYDWS